MSQSYQQNTSQMVLTLHKQIQSLTPLRVSYANLQHYHKKITSDLNSLIQQHDSIVCSLRANHQSLSAISLRNEQQRNSLFAEMKNQQNEQAKLILDMRNLGQKYESLNQKLQLQQNRCEQNSSNFLLNHCLGYKQQLQNITKTLKSHIDNLTSVNEQLRNSQTDLSNQSTHLHGEIQKQQALKQELEQKNQLIKNQAAKLNIKNEDLADLNRKFEIQIHSVESSVNSQNKVNRQHKERLIEIRAELDRINNEKNYKNTLLSSENQALRQMQMHQNKLESIIQTTKTQLSCIQNENKELTSQISVMNNTQEENERFLKNSSRHLNEIKSSNQLLLNQMEQFCMKDRQVQHLLVKKMVSLQFFSRKLSNQYDNDARNQTAQSYAKKNLFEQKSINQVYRVLEKTHPSKRPLVDTQCTLKQNRGI